MPFGEGALAEIGQRMEISKEEYQPLSLLDSSSTFLVIYLYSVVVSLGGL